MDLFDQDKAEPTIDDTDQIPDKYLERFKDAEKEAVIREKYKTDRYAESLTQRLDEMREDYLKLREEHMARASLQELVDRLAAGQLTSSDDTPANEDNDKPTIDLTKIDELVEQKLTQKELERKQTDNFNQVKKKLTERFGRNYQEVLKEQQETLGLSDEYVNSIAKSSPRAFFKLMGLDEEAKDNTFTSPPPSRTRSDSFAPRVEKRTWAYYEKMRKEQPKVYYSPKTQVQMHKDREELGQEFEDGSWR